MSPIPGRASIAARRMISRSPRLERLLWPTTDDGLRRRRDGSIVVSSAFRALTGREPTPGERSELLGRVKQGLDFEGLTAHLQETPEAATRTVDQSRRLLRQMLERDIAHAGTGDDGRPNVLFLHIMKTAGTSLSELLRQWAEPGLARVALPLDDLLLIPRPELGRLRAVSGHFPFEVLSVLPETFRTVTVLRDPVDRTVSHYIEYTRREDPDLSLDEFVHSEVYDVPSGNYQARQLVHSIGLAQAWITFSPMQLYLQVGGTPDQPYPVQALFDSTPLLMDDNQLLGKASARLAQIDMVGITEELDSLVHRLAPLFGVAPVSAPRLNTSSRNRAADLPANLRRVIERRTEVDRELYEQAVKLSRG